MALELMSGDGGQLCSSLKEGPLAGGKNEAETRSRLRRAEVETCGWRESPLLPPRGPDSFSLPLYLESGSQGPSSDTSQSSPFLLQLFKGGF